MEFVHGRGQLRRMWKETAKEVKMSITQRKVKLTQCDREKAINKKKYICNSPI